MCRVDVIKDLPIKLSYMPHLSQRAAQKCARMQRATALAATRYAFYTIMTFFAALI